MSRALITGVSGQDGWYLSEVLTAAGFEVFGLLHEPDHHGLYPGVTAVAGDLQDQESLRAALERARPSQIYNLAGISSVAFSWKDPVTTADVNATGLLRLIGAARSFAQSHGELPKIVQASSAEIFGSVAPPQNESTPIAPVSPYGASKAFAQHVVALYRRAGVPVSSAILYNHESPRRPDSFVTRRITAAVARIASGSKETLTLGNLEARRDWGFAGDYMRAMYLIAQHHDPDDFVVATGVSRSVADFVSSAFAHVGITDWQAHTQVDEALVRPVDVGEQRGDSSKARTILGWQPRTTFDDLVAAMVDQDLAGVTAGL